VGASVRVLAFASLQIQIQSHTRAQAKSEVIQQDQVICIPKLGNSSQVMLLVVLTSCTVMVRVQMSVISECKMFLFSESFVWHSLDVLALPACRSEPWFSV
jgi:hypothetical protein